MPQVSSQYKCIYAAWSLIVWLYDVQSLVSSKKALSNLVRTLFGLRAKDLLLLHLGVYRRHSTEIYALCPSADEEHRQHLLAESHISYLAPP